MNWSAENIFVYLSFDLILIASISNQQTIHLHMLDATFGPSTRELLKILCVFLLEAWNVQRSFSFMNRIHYRIRNSISTDLLGAFATINRHDNNAYMSIHLHRMMVSFTFYWGLYLLDICTFRRLLNLWYRFLQNLNPATRSFRTPNFIFIVL